MYIQNVPVVSSTKLGKRNFTEVTNVTCDCWAQCTLSYVSMGQCFSTGSTRTISGYAKLFGNLSIEARYKFAKSICWLRHVRLSEWNNSDATGLILVKFDI
jgi:hypothetical protein